jgi:hypothetical protein
MTRNVVSTYLRQSISLIVGMSLLALFCMNLWGKTEVMLMPVCISSVFQLVACIAYAFVWRWVMSTSPDSMPTLYMSASALRMFAAVVVVMAYCWLTDNRDSIRFFVAIFLIYYFVILIYDTWYFVKIEKKVKSNV